MQWLHSILFYIAFDTSDMKNKLLKCNLIYWIELFFISFDTFSHGAISIILYYCQGLTN